MVEAKNKWAKSTIQKLLLLSKVALLLFACGKRATIHTNLTPDKSDREASKTIGIPTDGKTSSDVDSSKGSAIGTPVTGEAISFPDTTDEGSTTPKAASSAISTPPCGEAIIDVDSSKGNSAIDASNATSVDGKAINADSPEDGKGSSTPKASSAISIPPSGEAGSDVDSSKGKSVAGHKANSNVDASMGGEAISSPDTTEAIIDVKTAEGNSAIGTPVTGETISFLDTTKASSAISTSPCGEAIIDVDSSKGNSAIDASNATSVDGKAINADSSEDGKGSSTPKASSAISIPPSGKAGSDVDSSKGKSVAGHKANSILLAAQNNGDVVVPTTSCSDLNKDNRMPGGMANAGNTCYVAATMQALAVVYDKTFSTIDTSSWTDERKAVAGAIEKVIRQIRGGQPVNYNGMKKFLQTLVENNWYPGGRQQDAEELLSFIFNIFGLNPPIKVASIISPIERDEAVPDSPKIEPSFILPLEIPEENKDSLDIQDCLLAFFKREEVDYKYEESGCWSKAYKKLRLTDDLPTIMAIQLKRFKQEWKVGKVIKQKIENSVNTPLFLTIPAACMNDGQASHAYNLVAFVVHIGKTLDFGHYIAYVKRVDKWFRCNDSWVGKVTESDASKEAKKAYVYFYQKQ